MMQINIPLLNKIFRYYRIFRQFIGYQFFIFLGLKLVDGFMEGVGIALFLPLLTQADITISENNVISSLLKKAITATGLDYSTQSVLIAIVLVISVKGMIMFVSGFLEASLIRKMNYKLRMNLIRSFSRIDYRFYTLQNTGVITNLLTTEVNRAMKAFKQYVATLAIIINILVLTAFSFILNWQFTIVAALSGATIVYLMKSLATVSVRLSTDYTKENGLFQTLLIQAVQAFKYLKSTSNFNPILKNVDRCVDRMTAISFKIMVIGAIIKSSAEPICIILVAMFIFYQTVVAGASIFPILVIMVIFLRIFTRVTLFQASWQKFCSHIGGIQIVSDFMNLFRENNEKLGSTDYKRLDHKIVFENVSFSYGDEPFMEGLNCEIKKNSMVALVGPSGAGKSTFVDLITGILRPHNGSIRIDEFALDEINLKVYRERIGFVPQDCVMFNDTIANNISLWKSENNSRDNHRLIAEAARKANSDQFIEGFNERYESLVGDRGLKLSGGQKQRIAIARELFNDPEILILDEATSALDTESERFIQKSIDNLKGSATIIVIAHRLSTVKNCDRIFVFDKGRIVEQGDFNKLNGNEDSYFSKMCRLQNLE